MKIESESNMMILLVICFMLGIIAGAVLLQPKMQTEFEVGFLSGQKCTICMIEADNNGKEFDSALQFCCYEPDGELRRYN